MKKIFLLFCVTFLFGEYFYSNNKKIELNLVSSSRDGVKFYSLKNGEILGVGNYILVKFKKGVETSKYEKEFNLTLVKKIKDIYVFKTPFNQALDISNRLYNLDDVIFAHPDFIHIMKKR